MPRNDGLHTTTHEKWYIDKLGSWTEKHPSLQRTAFLLRKYINECCQNRTHWIDTYGTDIEKEKCMKHAEKRLINLFE